MSVLRCQTCPRTYNRSVRHDIRDQAARAARWVVWEGTTMGGDHVRRVHCPECTGREARVERWDAECETCMVMASEEDGYYDDEPFTQEAAEDWSKHHQCEPHVRLISPEKVAKRMASSRKAIEEYSAYQMAVAS